MEWSFQRSLSLHLSPGRRAFFDREMFERIVQRRNGRAGYWSPAMICILGHEGMREERVPRTSAKDWFRLAGATTWSDLSLDRRDNCDCGCVSEPGCKGYAARGQDSDMSFSYHRSVDFSVEPLPGGLEGFRAPLIIERVCGTRLEPRISGKECRLRLTESQRICSPHPPRHRTMP